MERREMGASGAENRFSSMSVEEVQALDLGEMSDLFTAVKEGDLSRSEELRAFRDELNEALDLAHEEKDKDKIDALKEKIDKLKDIMYPAQE